MKNYIPNAAFDVNDEPIGDRRWFYQTLHQRSNEVWRGPEPDQFSPHTRTEEMEIEAALLEGELMPRNDWERRYFKNMGGRSKKADRPKAWVVCKKCGVEWQSTGWPAGDNKYTLDLGIKPHLINGRHYFFSTICIPCDDRMLATKQPPVNFQGRTRLDRDEPIQQQTRSPINDP